MIVRHWFWGLVLVVLFVTTQTNNVITEVQLNSAMLCSRQAALKSARASDCESGLQKLLEQPRVGERARTAYAGWLLDRGRFADVVVLLEGCVLSKRECDKVNLAQLAFAYSQEPDDTRHRALSQSYPEIGNYWLQRAFFEYDYARKVQLWETGLAILSIGFDTNSKDQQVQLGRRYYDLAKMYEAHGQRASSVDAYRRALECDPTYIPARLWYAVALAMDPPAAVEAFAQFREVLNRTNEPFYRFSAYWGLANLADRQGLVPEAASWLHVAQMDLPHSGLPSVALGLREEAHSNDEAALAWYQNALTIEPDNPDAHYLIALTLKRLGGPAETVIMHLQTALSKESKLYFVSGSKVREAMDHLSNERPR